MSGGFFVCPVVDAGVATVRLGGDIDTYTSPELARVLGEVIRTDVAEVAVDMAEVGFLDSSGLSALIDGAKQARIHGTSFRVAGPGPRLRRLFEITGLVEFLGVETG